MAFAGVGYRYKYHDKEWPFTLGSTSGFAAVGTQGFVASSYVPDSDSFSQATQLKLLDSGSSGAASL
jgi:hypothetical protein